mmetsp:Transcript_21743/g.53664  ORF Transcript_21743/g.53664 Transcript_21743/m.53664 type:complete len:300 (+) Transcript_21743:307-1206(+)
MARIFAYETTTTLRIPASLPCTLTTSLSLPSRTPLSSPSRSASPSPCEPLSSSSIMISSLAAPPLPLLTAPRMAVRYIFAILTNASRRTAPFLSTRNVAKGFLGGRGGVAEQGLEGRDADAVVDVEEAFEEDFLDAGGPDAATEDDAAAELACEVAGGGLGVGEALNGVGEKRAVAVEESGDICGATGEQFIHEAESCRPNVCVLGVGIVLEAGDDEEEGVGGLAVECDDEVGDVQDGDFLVLGERFEEHGNARLCCIASAVFITTWDATSTSRLSASAFISGATTARVPTSSTRPPRA